jgi:Ankyrin repeats (3 copies)
MAQCNGWLPLHLACANQITEANVIRLLLHVCPEAATACDEKGYLPLYIACNYGASMEIIKILLEIHANGTMVQGKDGSLPLHLACLRQMPLLPVVELLVQTCPDGLKVKNNDGYMPLEVSKIRDERREVLVTVKQSDKILPNDSIPIIERRIICSHVLRNALMSKCPLEAVQLSHAYLRKSTRKFSEQKNKSRVTMSETCFVDWICECVWHMLWSALDRTLSMPIMNCWYKN